MPKKKKGKKSSGSYVAGGNEYDGNGNKRRVGYSFWTPDDDPSPGTRRRREIDEKIQERRHEMWGGY